MPSRPRTGGWRSSRYWDSGFVAIDLTDPANPVRAGHTVYGTDEDGDAHSSMYDDARRLLFSADDDFCKNSPEGIEPGYGYCGSGTTRAWLRRCRSASTGRRTRAVGCP